ncbi:hypothetical protein BFL35_11960 [Clavibacter michiganensis]|nr:hypothetical protein BFL35_11960 [Clavibacter michiganensis]
MGYWTTMEEIGSTLRVGAGDPARRHSAPDSVAVRPECVPITSAKTVLSQGRTRYSTSAGTGRGKPSAFHSAKEAYPMPGSSAEMEDSRMRESLKGTE